MSRMFSLTRLSRVMAAATLAMLVAGASAACSKDKKNPTQTTTSIEGRWELTEIEGDELPVQLQDGEGNVFTVTGGLIEATDDEFELSLEIDGEDVGIESGDYEIDGDEVDFGSFSGELNSSRNRLVVQFAGLEWLFEKD
jgi:hypothetical protein